MPVFRQHHPLYDLQMEKRQVWSDFYEGGKQIRDKQRRYLKRHPMETEKQYEVRLGISAYRNFASPVVDVFSSSINEGRPARVIPDALRPVELDADRRGRSADVFFSDVTRLAAAEGSRFVLVDMTRGTGSRVLDEQAGRRMVPYFTDISADQVLDWSVSGADGALEWAVVEEKRLAERAPFETYAWETSVTVWDRQGWRRWLVQRDETGKLAEETGELAGEGIHGLGRVPLVPFLFEPSGVMTGASALDDVTDLLLYLYHLDSVRAKTLFDCGVPVLQAVGVGPEDAASFVKASSNAFCIPETAHLSYVETSGTSYESQTTEADKVISSIREISLRQLRAPSLSVESADAKRLDRAQLDSQLAKFASLCQSAEEACWRLAAKWIGVSEDGIQAPYNRDYSEADARARLVEQMVSLKEKGIISAQTVRESDTVKAMMPDGWTPDGEVDRMARGELENGSLTADRSLADFLKSAADG